MKKLFAFSILILLGIFPPKVNAFDWVVPPTGLEIGLGAWAETALTLDVSTSLYMSRHYNLYREINPLLGPAPTPGVYYAVWGGMTVLNLAVLFSPLPHWVKDTVFFGEGGIETWAVANNLSIGLHFAW